MAYPGFQRGVCLRSGPIQKVGGGLQFQYTKSGGGGALQVRYTKSGGALQVRYTKSGRGGGGFRYDIRKVGGGGRASGPIYQSMDIRKVGGGGGGRASGPIYQSMDIRKVGGGGGGGALQVRYTKSGAIPLQIPLGTQKISTCTYLRATSHARANERNIHAGKG